jgi:hypothetical protein
MIEYVPAYPGLNVKFKVVVRVDAVVSTIDASETVQKLSNCGGGVGFAPVFAIES